MFNKKFNKKGQGLSLNTIVIAALVVLVLVILSVVFMGGMAEFSWFVGNCEKKGGTCMDSSCTSGNTEIPGKCFYDGEVDKYQKCCQKVSYS